MWMSGRTSEMSVSGGRTIWFSADKFGLSGWLTYSPLQSARSRESDLVLSHSNFSIFSFIQGSPVAAQVFFLVFPSLLSFLPSFLK
jgi:hypothetical protein